MTDKEKFQKTFDKLHASPDVLMEVLNMTTNEKVVPVRKRRYIPKVAAAVAALVLVVGSGSAAYAMDLGGIQRVVQVWIHGDQTDATFTVENGTYTLDYKDAERKDVHQGGGGVAFNAPEVLYEDDGKVFLYYLDQKLDITDKFEDGICYIELQVDSKIQYMTIKYQNGYAMSPHGYVQPWEFN